MEEKKTLDLKERVNIVWRTTFLQGSWNFERMQNGGWAYAVIPAIRKLYPDEADKKDALKRHLQFFNTHPYVASPIIGVILGLEEERANGKVISDEDIQTIKEGMMGPLAGVADTVFWFSLRPLLAAIGAAMAISGHIIGPIFFFVVWNVIRYIFMYLTQELGYEYKTSIVELLTEGFLNKIVQGASMIGLFMMGALVQRYVIVQYQMEEVQNQMDALLPGVSGLVLTLVCVYLLRKKVPPLVLIVGIFVLGIIGYASGILSFDKLMETIY